MKLTCYSFLAATSILLLVTCVDVLHASNLTSTFLDGGFQIKAVGSHFVGSDMCLTYMGALDDPFGVVYVSSCNSDNLKQKWLMDALSGYICAPFSGYCFAWSGKCGCCDICGQLEVLPRCENVTKCGYETTSFKYNPQQQTLCTSDGQGVITAHGGPKLNIEYASPFTLTSLDRDAGYCDSPPLDGKGSRFEWISVDES